MDTQNLLKLTKEQRKSLYKWWWKYYTETYGGDEYCPGNPNLSNLIYTTYLACTTIINDRLSNEDLECIIEIYRPKFVIWAQKRVKKNGGWPKKQNRTKVIKIFLDRGFVHTSDVDYVKEKYPVVTLIGELMWPIYFENHQEALECSKRFGVPGYTKCPIPSK